MKFCKMIKVLDLGAGEFKVNREYLEKYLSKYLKLKEISITSVDNKFEADINYDLEKIPWNFAKDEEYDIVFASHILEHLNDTFSAMKEIYRILKKEGILFVRVPHFKSKFAFIDLTHKKFFAYESFDVFTKPNVEFCFEILEKRFEYHDWRKSISLKGKLFALTYGKILEFFANRLPKIYENLSIFAPIPELVVLMRKKICF